MGGQNFLKGNVTMEEAEERCEDTNLLALKKGGMELTSKECWAVPRASERTSPADPLRPVRLIFEL